MPKLTTQTVISYMGLINVQNLYRNVEFVDAESELLEAIGVWAWNKDRLPIREIDTE